MARLQHALELVLEPIGVVRSEISSRAEDARQPRAAAGTQGRIELFPGRNFEHALEDLDGWEMIWVVFWFHLNASWRPKVLPPRSNAGRKGVFSTRSPHRPNPIGLSAVRLERVEGLCLQVRDIDLLDGTPVLDIKPDVPYTDAYPEARSGWLDDAARPMRGGTPGDTAGAYHVRFLDDGYPRWSTEHYNQSIRPLLAEALGDTAATDVEHYIRTHDSTDLDWQNDPVGSAVRTADNMAIFHQEKLPPVFRYVPGNTDVLTRMATGEVDVDGARAAMRDNIAATDYSPEIKERLNVAVDEVGAQTAKFTLGMLGGFVDRFDWVEDHVQVTIRRNEKMDLPQKVLDLGQAQFAKAAKAYGIDPAKFRQDLAFTFADPTGKPLLSAVIRAITRIRAGMRAGMRARVRVNPTWRPT